MKVEMIEKALTNILYAHGWTMCMADGSEQRPEPHCVLSTDLAMDSMEFMDFLTRVEIRFDVEFTEKESKGWINKSVHEIATEIHAILERNANNLNDNANDNHNEMP